MCCGKLSETDEDGITTSYGYNSAHQLVEIIRSEVKDGDVVVTPETITTYTYDAAGRTLSTRRDIGAMTTTESTAYDALGRVTAQTDVLGRVTTTAYSADGLTTTETTPAGATTITRRNLDGSTARVFGTAQREVQYSYTRNGNNLVTTTALADGSVLGQNITNGFEQSIVQAQPNTLGGFIYTYSEYNAKGQMVKQYQNTGEDSENTAPTLLEYNSFGKQVKQALALVDTPTKDNSPVAEMAYSVESAEDDVYSVITQTRYNAAGEPLSATQKQLISQLSATLASKSISTDVRGNTSVNWTEFTAPTKVTSYSTVPTSNITAESISIDGFTISQKNHVGIVTTASRSFTASGMTLVQVDGRGNATTTAMDQAGRTISVTDAAGAITSTVYDIVHDQPSVVTDAMGNTACYKYDHRGRKIAEWGTAQQPACFGYDDMDNMTTLHTFRVESEVITTDPSERSDGDVTTWVFHPSTGLELSKTYADNTSVIMSYDAYNRLATETDARGNVKTHSYEHARGLHLGTSYTVVEDTAETAARSFTYNHLGQMTQLVDDSGTRSFGYNTYGESETDTLVIDGVTHLITELRDAFGRSTGYTYSKNGDVQQTVSTAYGSDGRIDSAGFLHGSEMKQFGYEYLQGTNLLHKLTKPNNMTLTQTYESTRNLLTGMAYHRSSTLVTQREYTYDILGRPTSRNTARNGQIVNDTFAHNTRSELVEAQVKDADYEYAYDNVGNRQQATEGNDVTLYDASALNQYTSISENGVAAFVPQYDADGNQTLIKTETGIWSAIYNAENRPTSFTNEESGTAVECTYDSMGRRAYKKVTTNGSVTLHQRYIYRGYLQIACIDLTRSHHPCMWLLTWDPSQPDASRPLAIQINGTWYTYGWDLTKNICEIYGSSGYIATTYTYTPFGSVIDSGAVNQPIQWSSEYHDEESSLVYYNYRYYNSMDGRWITRDFISKKNRYSKNNTILFADLLGLEDFYITVTYSYNLKFTYRDTQANRLYLYSGFEINDKYKVTEKVNIDCSRRTSKRPVVGIKTPNYKVVKEGNHILETTMQMHGFGAYAYNNVKNMFESQREHWSGQNKYITPNTTGSITDKSSEGIYHIIDVNSSAIAHRHPTSRGGGDHGVVGAVGDLAIQMLRKYKPIDFIFKMKPIIEKINEMVSLLNEIPETSEAAVNGQIWACCDSNSKIIWNYIAAKGTSLPIGSTFEKKLPGRTIDNNSAKFTVDLDVALNPS